MERKKVSTKPVVVPAAVIPEPKPTVIPSVVIPEPEPVIVPLAPVVEPEPIKKLRWKKIGGGSLRLFHKIIKPNEIFYAHESEIPKSFMDTIICMEDVEVREIAKRKEEAIPPKTPEKLYEVKLKSVGWYNVIQIASGKPINPEALRKTEAETLCSSLNL
jgi:hypothetical protein